MLAHYGYQDGSGEYLITVDTDECNGCGDCVEACPVGVLAMVEDEFDIEADDEIPAVTAEHGHKLKYSCASCKPASGYTPLDLPCVAVCTPAALGHSW